MKHVNYSISAPSSPTQCMLKKCDYCLNIKRYPIARTLKRGSRGKPYVSTLLSQIVHRWFILQIHTIAALFTKIEKGKGGGDCSTNIEQE